MVFTEVYVIYGFPVTTEQLTKWGFSFDEDLNLKAPDGWKGGYAEYRICSFPLSNKALKLYRFVCCSPSAEEKWIIGVRLHRHYRRPKRCEECPGPHSVCDRCLGETNAGFINTALIFQEPVWYPIEQCCFNCHGFIPGGVEKCEVCWQQSNPQRNVPGHIKSSMVKVLNGIRYLKDDLEIVKSELGVYLMLNDCTWCS